MNFSRFLIYLTLFSASICAKIEFQEPWGKDSSLATTKNSPQTEEMHSFLGRVFENLIRFHTHIISPVDGPRSHFRPTSSRYMLLAMRKYGVVKGFIKGCDRLLRENNEKWVYRTIVIKGQEYKHDPY